MKTSTFNKINTLNEKTIANSLTTGQFVRNGGLRLFEITSVSETSIELTSINGERTQTLYLSKSVFSKLFKMGNYTQVYSKENFRREAMESTKIGGERFLIKLK